MRAGIRRENLIRRRADRGNQILSVTNVASFVERGVTLGIEMENNKPKVLLNLTSSESEGLNWDPKILKISRTVR